MRKTDAQAWVKTEQKWFLTVMHTERRALHRAGRVDAVEALTRLITKAYMRGGMSQEEAERKALGGFMKCHQYE